MNNREAFRQQLYSTIIPSNISPDEQQIAIETLQKAANNCLSSSLFRFRECTERHVSAFDRDELWVSTSDCMNDGFDTRIYIDKKEVEEQINKWIQNGVTKEMLLNNINKILPSLPPVFTAAIEQIKALPEEEMNKARDALYTWIISDTAQALLLIPSVGQQVLKFCCFCEDISSPAMWGIYAKNESGFALEYDFNNAPYAASPDQYSRDCTLFPVIYDDKRYQVPTEYVLYLLQCRLLSTAMRNIGLDKAYPDFVRYYLATGICPDLLMATKFSLHKSNEWIRESEWRMFCTSSDIEFQNAKLGCCIKKPTALYLGRRISPINEKILRKLAEEKAIPVYKMMMDDQSASYRLTAEI